jgi:hypothetical protein
MTDKPEQTVEVGLKSSDVSAATLKPITSTVSHQPQAEEDVDKGGLTNVEQPNVESWNTVERINAEKKLHRNAICGRRSNSGKTKN